MEAEREAMNYPWSGKLGRIADCCIYCGDSSMTFQLSSAPNRCCYCKSTDTPVAELYGKFVNKSERLAREWCAGNGYDYDAEIAKGKQ